MKAVLSIGSNLEDRYAALEGVYREFYPELIAASQLYATPPWGVTDQEDFLNAVLILNTPRTPHEMLQAGQALEQAADRIRTRKWGPRTLDVDVVSCFTKEGEPIVFADPELTLPHPWAHQRAFVLVPWLEIDPDATLDGVRVRNLISRLDPAEVAAVRAVGNFSLGVQK